VLLIQGLTVIGDCNVAVGVPNCLSTLVEGAFLSLKSMAKIDFASVLKALDRILGMEGKVNGFPPLTA